MTTTTMGLSMQPTTLSFRTIWGIVPQCWGGNGSGAATIVQADYLLWAQNFTGLGASSSAAVPEPSALLLLFVVLSALWSVRLH